MHAQIHVGESVDLFKPVEVGFGAFAIGMVWDNSPYKVKYNCTGAF